MTDEVIAQIVELSRLTCENDESFDAFLAARGWRYSDFDDSYETAAGQVVWTAPYAPAPHRSAHRAAEPANAAHPAHQTAWATFCVYDPEYDGVPDAEHLAAVWGGARGWSLHADQGRARLDADWQAAAGLLTARYGHPVATAARADLATDSPPTARRHFALWHTGDRALLLAQDPDPVCYACFIRNVLVIVPVRPDRPLPARASLPEWYACDLLGQGAAI